MAAVEDVTALAEVARRADCLDQALAVLVAARDRLPPRSRYG